MAREGVWLARRRAWCQLPLESCPARTHLAHPPSAIHLHHTPRSLHCNLHIYLLSLPTIATLTTAIPSRRLPPHLDTPCRHSLGHHHLHIPAGKGATTASETHHTREHSTPTPRIPRPLFRPPAITRLSSTRRTRLSPRRGRLVAAIRSIGLSLGLPRHPHSPWSDAL